MEHSGLAVLGCVLGAVLSLVSGCGSPDVTGVDLSGQPVASGAPAGDDRLIDVGDGRVIDVVCTGQGSPTVVLVPGSRESHEAWQVVASKPGTSAAYVSSDDAVFSAVGRRTRVCTYDRPGVPLLDGSLSRSSLVEQPTTAQQGADDLAAWLAAAGERGPFVVVAHSWGGLIALRFAQVRPDTVAGLVLVDPASVQLRDALTPRQWQDFLGIIGPLLDGSGHEVPDYANTVDVIAQGPPVPGVPAVVLTSDRPFDYGIGTTGTWPAWLRAQDLLATSLNAEHVTNTDSGHLIMIEQPDIVSRAILDVVEDVRVSDR